MKASHICHGMRMIGSMIVWVLALTPPSEGQVWDQQRQQALVRFEIPDPRKLQPNVGTGVMVQGLQGRTYVLTSTYVLTPEAPLGALPESCAQLPVGSQLREGSSGGAVLEVRCVR